MSRESKRFTVEQMKRKYDTLRIQNYEQVMITDVINDLYRIIRDRRIPTEDL